MRVNPIIGCRPYFQLLSRSLEKMPFHEVDSVAQLLVRAYHDQRTVFLFGNGGSAALASHFACDLGKGTINGSPKRFRVMALTDNVPLMTAWANDSNYEDIFAEQLANFAGPDDIAFAVSGSGNSRNVLKALRLAQQMGMLTAGLTGFSGGQMRPLCDACIVVPCDNMQIIEDLHLCIAHSLFTCVRAQIADAPHSVLRPHLVRRTVGR
jgi:D-sedoheptulose 7-phosphate isomerase